MAVRGIARALAAGDWPRVAEYKAAVAAMDAEAAAGVAIRTHLPLVDQERPGAAHAAEEGRFGPSPGLRSLRAADGTLLHDPGAVEEEVARYFSALFNGRHAATAGAAEPVDSGTAFQPDEACIPEFLRDLHTLSQEDAERLERPFSLFELQAAVESAAAAKSPGLDGLSYEFYKAALPLVGPALLDGLNSMLEDGRLAPSMRKGLVRLLPKVAATPAAHQLRPITLLCTDYKLLTKMIVARLLPLLPSVVSSGQLCSIAGRSIFEGPATVLSTAAFLESRRRPGFLLSLDFFHAYDRVSMVWMDRVLDAMGFGVVFRSWVATLHRDAAAAFLLHRVSRPLAVNFSIRQGDPLSGLLFILYVEPFLKQLEAQLRGIAVAGGREIDFSYMDDVEILGDDLRDISRTDRICRRFEAASGAILNRNRKTVVLGLGTWAGRQEWPLPWLQAASPVKVLGFPIAADYTVSSAATWDRVVTGVRKSLAFCSSRHLPTILQRVEVANTFSLSKIWYFCQVMPLPPDVAATLRRAVADFVWKGRFERLPFDETHSPLTCGGIGLPCLQTRAEALLTKQYSLFIAGGGRLAAHAAMWIGGRVPGLQLLLPPPLPVLPVFEELVPLLCEASEVPAVAAGGPPPSSRLLYRAWTSDLPPPKIELKLRHLPWRRVWRRLASLAPSLAAQDLHFSVLHNILPIPSRLHRYQRLPDASCWFCPHPLADCLHFFTSCPRVEPAWARVVHRASAVLPIRPSSEDLLFLAWGPAASAADDVVAFAVMAFTSWAWESRESATPLDPADLPRVVSEAAAAQGPLRTLFTV